MDGENLEKPFIISLEVWEMGAEGLLVVAQRDGGMVSSECAGDEVSYFVRGHSSGISRAS